MIPCIFVSPEQKAPFMIRPAIWIMLLLLIVAQSHRGLTQPRPDAQCTVVSRDTVTISWTIENQDFARYYFYKSYNLMDPVFIGMVPDNTITSYTYIESLPITGPIYYWLYTEDISGGIQYPNSDTVSILFLSATPVQNNGIAQLTWNKVEENPGGYYTIYRQAAGQSDWLSIGSTMDQIYFDTITSPFCTDTLMRYYVEYHDPSITCVSRSTVGSATLYDGIYPGWLSNDIIEMDTVSVDFQGNVSISWEAYPANDIQWYFIYRNDMAQSGWYVIDSVPGWQLDYTDNQSTANLESVAYRVAAKDTCHAPGPGGFANPFSTIFLKPILWDYCDTSVLLQWDSTLWMEPYPDLFSVYDIDTSTFTYHPIGETTETGFEFVTGFKPDTTYCYFVRANNATGKSSTSCIQCFYVDRPEQPDTLNLRMAGVDTSYNNRISITVFVDTLPSQTKCLLLRKTAISDPYDTVDAFPVTDQDHLFFTDTTAQVGLTAYYYRTIILDGCNNSAWLPLNEVRTVHLEGTAMDQVNRLYWNRYQSTGSRVTGYRLHRKIDGITDTIFMVGQDTVFDDILTNQTSSGGRFSYLVEYRTLPLFNELLDTLSGFSNEISVVQISRINMPNAFTPNGDGINDFFSPRNIFTEDHTEYLFIIYNRWGQKVFVSSSISDVGWDGTFLNTPSPTGVYVYFIRYVSIEGEIFESRGPFTLLR